MLGRKAAEIKTLSTEVARLQGARMQAEAETKANELAALGLRRFYESGEAEAYRQKVRADTSTPDFRLVY